MLQNKLAENYKPNKQNRESTEKYKHLSCPVFSTILKSHQIRVPRTALTGLQDYYCKAIPHKAQLSEITLQSNVYQKVPHGEEELTAV